MTAQRPSVPSANFQPDYRHVLSVATDQNISVPVEQLLELKAAGQRLAHSTDAMVRRRNNVLLARDQAIYEWDASHYKFSYVQESQQEITAHLETLGTQIPSDPTVKKLANIFEQLLCDYEAFQHQAAKLKTVEERLRTAEKKLQRKEDATISSVQDVLQKIDMCDVPRPLAHSLRPSQAVGNSVEPLHTSEQRRADSPSLHPAVAAFYEKVANLRIMRERRSQLRAEQEEERIRRVIKDAQHMSLDVTETDFLKGCQADFELAERDVGEATTSLRVARWRCEQEGVAAMIDEALVEEETLIYAQTPEEAGVVVPSTPSSPSVLPLLQDPVDEYGEPSSQWGMAAILKFVRSWFSPEGKGVPALGLAEDRVKRWVEGLPPPEARRYSEDWEMVAKHDLSLEVPNSPSRPKRLRSSSESALTHRSKSPFGKFLENFKMTPLKAPEPP